MPSSRIVAVSLAGLLLGAGAFAVLLLRQDSPAATGDLIAYGCREAKNPWYAICVMRSDGTEQRRLTEKLSTTDPSWSPDGRRIAFTRNEDVGESTKFTSDDVFVMDADGGDVRRLTAERAGRSSGQPSWSRDGSQIVYVHGPSVHASVPSRFGGLFVMDADGGAPRRLTQGRADTDPDWSPSGDEIVFVRGTDLASPTDSNQDLYILDLRTGASRRLTDTKRIYESAPAWSPDGDRIAYARWTSQTQFGGTAELYTLRPDGTDERLVLEYRHFAPFPYSLAWSPDGRWIALETSSPTGCAAISLVDVDGGAVRPLSSCSRPRESTVSPAWQPDAHAVER